MNRFVFVLLMCATISARARVFDFPDGKSPNGQYNVRAVEHEASITYDILRLRDGPTIHRIYSSYQRDEGELPDWSWNHTTEASIAWSPDSRYMCIDEEVHRYEGEVLLAEITRAGVREIQLPIADVLAGTKAQMESISDSAEARMDFARLVIATIRRQALANRSRHYLHGDPPPTAWP